MNTLETANSWIERGFSVIPIAFRSKRPAFNALKITGCVVNGKVSWSMFKERQATESELKAWFTGPKRNIGIVTGYNELVVLDFDTREFYEAWCQWVNAVGGEASNVKLNTFTVYSSRGVHVYIRCKELVESFSIEKTVDIKARWGYVLAPPSVHPSGWEYRAVGESVLGCTHLSDVFPLTAPKSLADTLDKEIITDPWNAADHATVCRSLGAIERIRSKLSIFDLLGITLNGRKSTLIRCPLHEDHNPSMLVYADGYCRCLAGCKNGKQMDVIGLYAAVHGITNREAITILGQI